MYLSYFATWLLSFCSRELIEELACESLSANVDISLLSLLLSSFRAAIFSSQTFSRARVFSISLSQTSISLVISPERFSMSLASSSRFLIEVLTSSIWPLMCSASSRVPLRSVIFLSERATAAESLSVSACVFSANALERSSISATLSSYSARSDWISFSIASSSSASPAILRRFSEISRLSLSHFSTAFLFSSVLVSVLR